MSRAARATSFLFEPARWRNDPAVLAMTDEARGCYAMLFTAAWDQKDPGVIPAIDRVLCSLAGTTPDVWERVRDQVAAAFDTSPPGVWISKGLVATYESQTRAFRRRSAAGAVAGKASAHKRQSTIGSASGERIVNRTGSGSGSGTENHPPAAAAPPRAREAPRPATPAAPARRRRQVRSAPRSRNPVRTCTSAQIEAAAQRFGLKVEAVQLLADRIELEFDDRGYRSAPSALLTWCEREALNPAPTVNGANGAHRDRRGKLVTYGQPETRCVGVPGVPGNLSWGESGRLGTVDRGEWRMLTHHELKAWQRAVSGAKS